MRLTTVILIASLMQVSAATFGQRITLSQKNTPLKTVLRELTRQSGYDFVYNGRAVGADQKVTVSLSNAEFDEVLKSVLAGLNLSYKIDGKIVSIRKVEEPSIVDRITAQFQVVDVRGKVVDEQNQPLAGASVTVKGKSQGAKTDAEGNFYLANVDEKATVLISFVGFKTSEFAVKEDLGILTMKLEDNSLEQVQVIAYGEVKKKFLTSNIGSISGEQISRQPVTNPLLAMQGRVPGLFIQQTSGNTLGNVNVLIQGRNSIRNGVDPFYVIDGIPYSPTVAGTSLADGNFPPISTVSGGSAFNFINPADIESIEILKDADATAIYGSRAANGAILITTKKGKAGRTKVDLNIQSGVGKIARRAKLMNTAQYLELRKEAYMNDNLPVPTSSTGPTFSNFDLTIWDPNKNHDWQEELVGGTANFTNIQMSVSGGSEYTQFLVSAGYNKQTTVYPTDLADRKYNVHLNLNHASENRKLNFSLSTSYLQSNNTLPSVDLMSRALSLAPNSPDLYNPDGSLNWGPYPTNSNQFSFLDNPVAVLMRKYSGVTDNILANSLISYEILPGLQLKSTIGYNLLLGDEVLISPIAALPPNRPSRTGSSDFIDKRTQSYIIEPQLTYNKLTKWGYISFLLGSTFQQSESNVSGYNASGFSSDNQLSNISAATTVTPAYRDLQTLYRYNAFFARMNYRLQNKYILNLNVRRDGSSRFGANNKLHDFYSVGAAWLFAEEQWIKQILPSMSTGKLRINYGTVGNDQLPDYAYESLLQNDVYGGIAYQNLASIRPFRHSNPNLQWEETRKLNVGLDLGFFNERINFSGNYYRNRSSNQLIGYLLPDMTGFPIVETNLSATVQNTGVELLLNASLVKASDFEWQVSVNATIPRNKLVYFKDFEKSTVTYLYVIGEPVNIVASKFLSAGVDPNTGLYQFRTANGEITNWPSFATDAIGFVSTNPKWYGGFSNTLRYKNFSLDILFQYVNQIGQNDRFISGAGRMHVNLPTYVYENRWKTKGQITDVDKVSTGFVPSRTYAGNSTGNYSDASFLRLKNISLTYSLPTQILKKIGMQSARLYLQGQNLLTVTDYRGIDPENSIYTSLPPLKMCTAGLQVTF